MTGYSKHGVMSLPVSVMLRNLPIPEPESQCLAVKNINFSIKMVRVKLAHFGIFYN